MNSLNQNIPDGTKVVMEGDVSEEERTVTVKGGFGAMSFTSGTALFAEDRYGNPMRLNAMEIEKIVE